MSKFHYYTQKLNTIPVHLLIWKIFSKIIRIVHSFLQRGKDVLVDTRLESNIPIIKNSYIGLLELDINVDIAKDKNKYINKMYLNHRFDLLGSGWIQNSYDSESVGLENYKYKMNVSFNLKKLLPSRYYDRSKNIYAFVDKKYIPIDWQKDFKSGYRWSNKTWYKDCLKDIGRLPGIDIKVPWELARMQHLPQMATFSRINLEYKNKNIVEFKNQVLDFIATNPPRWGVNWSCSMDVAIRAVSMILAYDMLCQLDDINILDDEFKQIFTNSIYEHGTHIVNNLEYWGNNLSNNHYLSNICGLLFISAYLEDDEKTTTWLAFSLQELMNEFKRQFYEDGGNFESSTSYHRLSGELVVYTTALLLGLSNNKINLLKKYKYSKWPRKPKLLPLEEQEYKIVDNKIVLPQWYVNRLYRMGSFSVDVTKPGGEISQFGDNDSGRFIKLTPIGNILTNDQAEKKYLSLTDYCNYIKQSNLRENNFYWDENDLDHTHFISAVSGLFNNEKFYSDTSVNIIEKSFIESLAKQIKLIENCNTYKKLIPEKIDCSELKHKQKHFIINETEISEKQNIIYKKNGWCVIDNKEFDSLVHKNNKADNLDSLKNNLSLMQYPDFGIYIFKSKRLHLAISAINIAKTLGGAHVHNDKLSFELNIDRKDIFLDPGTYIYTPLPSKRKTFRSTHKHNTICVLNKEQNRFNQARDNVFCISKDSSCKLIEVSSNSISLLLTYQNIKNIRTFIIHKNSVEIISKSNMEFSTNWDTGIISNGYGKLLSKTNS